jgi:hypothetical protein
MKNYEATDRLIISLVTNRWSKVALIVGLAMIENKNQTPKIQDADFAGRISYLVENGFLESQGDISQIRFSEVRLSNKAYQ